MSKLLPPDFDDLVLNAVKTFWLSRNSNAGSLQEGSRGAVISGKNMDGFAELIRKVALYCDIPESCIITSGKKNLTIPGYFRPTKMWDAIIIYKGRLLAAFEFKSQVGSFGNNFNNRTEESVGSAKDFWTAHREEAFDLQNYINSDSIKSTLKKSKPPFLGYLMLLEESSGSTKKVSVAESHYKVFPEFENSSYARRYQLLCEKLVFEGLYSSSSLILSDKVQGEEKGYYSIPSKLLSPKSLFSDFAGRLLSVKEIY